MTLPDRWPILMQQSNKLGDDLPKKVEKKIVTNKTMATVDNKKIWYLSLEKQVPSKGKSIVFVKKVDFGSTSS